MLTLLTDAVSSSRNRDGGKKSRAGSENTETHSHLVFTSHVHLEVCLVTAPVSMVFLCGRIRAI